MVESENNTHKTLGRRDLSINIMFKTYKFPRNTINYKISGTSSSSRGLEGYMKFFY